MPTRADIDAGAVLTAQLAGHAGKLKPLRGSSPLANDMFEAADDWTNLGNLLAEHSDQTDFASRARQEQELLERLRLALLRASSEDQVRYGPILEAGAQLIEIAGRQVANPDGALGFLRVIRARFGFLAEHGFVLGLAQPSAARFSSGGVFVRLELCDDPAATCIFGLEAVPEQSFGLDDLLFLHGDPAWQRLAERRPLRNEAEVDGWFAYAARLLEESGADILAGTPASFARLKDAQDRRDATYIQFMDERFALRT